MGHGWRARNGDPVSSHNQWQRDKMSPHSLNYQALISQEQTRKIPPAAGATGQNLPTENIQSIIPGTPLQRSYLPPKSSLSNPTGETTHRGMTHRDISEPSVSTQCGVATLLAVGTPPSPLPSPCNVRYSSSSRKISDKR
jgi:hypothetical protein